MPKLLITPDLTLYQALRRVISEYPERLALSFGDQTLTFRELGEQVDGLARGLRGLGVGPGDKVAIILPNCPEFVYAFFAPAALGAVIVPLNPVYRQKEIQHILSDSEASVVIADPQPMGNDVQGILDAVWPSLPRLQHVVMRGKAGPGYLNLADLHGDTDDGRRRTADHRSIPLMSGGRPPSVDGRVPLSPERVSPDDLCALVYTSGTTGVPKAVMHSHRSMIAAVSQGESTFNLPLHVQLWRLVKLTQQYGTRFLRWGLKQPTVLGPAPIHHLLGYSALIYGLLYGYRIVIADRFQPARVLQLIEQEHVNAMIAAPTMVAALLNSQEFSRLNLSSLLYVLMGAAPCPPDLVRRARQAFGCPVVIAFGATEVGGATLITNPRDPEHLQAETVGRLFPGMEARIVDEERREVPRGQIGELALRLGSVMLGYYKAPELNAQALDEEGWYYTGDLATMDEQGYVRIVGRKKDMIIRGGQNVYPAEIENHLLSKPGIREVAVIGVPDPLAGERVWAFVVPQDGAALTPTDVWSYCRGELAAYKVPDQVRIIDTLPMTSTGKVQKFLLRDMAFQEQQVVSSIR